MQYGICVGFNFDGTFFDEKIALPYDNRSLEIIMGKPNDSHRIRTSYHSPKDYKPIFQTISRFLSELSWKLRIEVYIDICIHGNGLSNCSSPNNFSRSKRYLIHDFRQEVFANDQHLALGFYREGYGSNSPFYQFLSFYKILEIPFWDGKSKSEWVNSLIPRLSSGLKSNVDYMRINGVKDIAKWIFIEGRNGLSHAYKEKQNLIVDITAFDHWQNIVCVKEIVRELAEITMIEKLKIPKR